MPKTFGQLLTQMCMFYSLVLVFLIVSFTCSLAIKKYRWQIVEVSLIVVYIAYLVHISLCAERTYNGEYNFNPCLLIEELRYKGFEYVMFHRLSELVSFIPVGILLAFVFHYSYPASKRRKKSFLSGMTISVFCETTLYFTGCGIFDIVDIVLNVLGCCVGIYFHQFFFSKIGLNPIAIRIERRNQFNRKVFLGLLWKEVNGERCIWFLFVFSLSFSFLSFECLECHTDFLHDMRTMLNNLSYSYIAGVIFYITSSFLPRLKKTHKAKLHLQKTYSGIYTNLVCIAEYLNCFDGNQLCEAPEIKIITEMQYAIPDSSEEDGRNLMSKIKAALKEVTTCNKKKKLKRNEFAVSLNKAKHLNALFTICSIDIDECMLLYSDVLTLEEINDLNGFRHCFDKLFYSRINLGSEIDFFVVQKSDIDYFASDFVLKYHKAERLKKEYDTYSSYAN